MVDRRFQEVEECEVIWFKKVQEVSFLKNSEFHKIKEVAYPYSLDGDIGFNRIKMSCSMLLYKLFARVYNYNGTYHHNLEVKKGNQLIVDLKVCLRKGKLENKKGMVWEEDRKFIDVGFGVVKSNNTRNIVNM